LSESQRAAGADLTATIERRMRNASLHAAKAAARK
jgi:hypothetical protein